jgi:uncharacterized protein (TIGR02231 family)
MRPLPPAAAPLALALALAAAPSAACAEDVHVGSRVDAVTVYRSSARVTRVARAAVPAGDVRLLLDGLPDGLDDDSIRVAGRGGARLHGVAVDRITAEAPPAEIRAAEERVERLAAEDKALEDAIQIARARAKFVESLRSTYAEERAKNLAVRGVSAKEWADLAAFVEGELAASAAAVRRAEGERRELGRRLAAARADLEKVQAKRGRTTKTVAVEVSADAPGTVELAVTYAVPAASWQPIWDARLDPEASRVELALQGTVSQASGEDWTGVRLSLSTAQPARTIALPRLDPRWLGRVEPAAERSRAYPKALPPSAIAEGKRAAAADALDEARLEAPAASVEQGLLATVFTAPRRESVDGSGRARKVPLARFPLEASVARTAAPRLDPAAFLAATAVNETGLPLLGGTAGVWVGDEFVGRTALPMTPAGGELRLGFGADDRIELERKVLERRRETAGLLTKDEVWRYRVRIAVKNRYALPVSLALEDLVPVSRDEKVKVAVLDGTTPGAKEDPSRPGVRTWTLALPPRKETVVELRYEVRCPEGFPIAGLE